ncbi:MAG: carbohydrate ABC transporter permease [Acidimicrobiia bacterium]
MTTLTQKRYLADNPRFLAGVFMSPAIVYIIALVGFPFVLSIIYAFTDISTGNPELDFVGFDTFARVIDDPVFREALWNTFRFAIISNLVVVVLATGLAEVLTREFKGKWLVRFLILLPWVAPVSLSTITWLWTFDSIFSPIDWLLREAGLLTENMYWLGRPELAIWAVILVQAWRIAPLAAVIVMAGLIAIPDEINDAVAVDGAGTWRKLFQVTIPLLAPIIAVAVLFGVILSISDMSLVYVLTRGGPTNSTQILSTWAFIKGIEGGSLSQGAAVALFLLPVLVGITAVVLRLARRREVL